QLVGAVRLRDALEGLRARVHGHQHHLGAGHRLPLKGDEPPDRNEAAVRQIGAKPAARRPGDQRKYADEQQRSAKRELQPARHTTRIAAPSPGSNQGALEMRCPWKDFSNTLKPCKTWLLPLYFNLQRWSVEKRNELTQRKSIMSSNLRGKVALVTGGSRGIG